MTDEDIARLEEMFRACSPMTRWIPGHRFTRDDEQFIVLLAARFDELIGAAKLKSEMAKISADPRLAAPGLLPGPVSALGDPIALEEMVRQFGKLPMATSAEHLNELMTQDAGRAEAVLLFLRHAGRIFRVAIAHMIQSQLIERWDAAYNRINLPGGAKP